MLGRMKTFWPVVCKGGKINRVVIWVDCSWRLGREMVAVAEADLSVTNLGWT
jgi:hypothetical protein